MRAAIDFTGPMLTNTGGTTYPRYILPRWAARDDDELVAFFSGGQVPADLSQIPGVVELPRLTGNVSLNRGFDLHVRLRGELARRRPDVAYFPGNSVPYGPRLGVPTVVAIRATVVYHYPGEFGRLRRAYLRATTARSTRSADRIIVPSAATADDLMRFAQARREKLVVVPHGVDIARFGRVVRDPQPTRFLFVSKPFDYKGLETLLRAMRILVGPAGLLPDATLDVADGGIPPSQSARLAALGSRLGVSGAVKTLGRVEHDQLVDRYAKASALVVPSSYESFGNTYLEAAAAGCPVITGRGGGIDETIGPVAVQVSAHDHAALADAMIQMAGLGSRERAARSAELRTWAGRFSWDTTLERTREVLGEVAR